VTVAGAVTASGVVTGATLVGTLTTAAQTNVTSLSTLTALQVDNININGNTISSTAGTDLLITPLSGQQLILDGTIIIDAGVVTAATSITSTEFVGGGVGLTALNATQITSGTLPAARIADDSIVEAKLDVSNGPTNGQFLQAQSGEGGGLTWAAAGGTTYTTGSTNVHAVNDATTGVTLNNNYKFTMVMPSSGEGFFFKCADQGSEQSALYYADYPSQITKIAGSSKWSVLDGGQTGSSGAGFFYVVSDANSRTITVFNREGNNRTITVHGMGRLASVTAQASI